MTKCLVTDELWAAIEPLLPPEPSKRRGGRPRCDDRAALSGIVFVLRSGIPWTMLPAEFGCSGMTCWRRLRDWQAAGVWDALHRTLLERLAEANELEWNRASLDSAAVAAKKGMRDRPEPDRSRQTGHEAPNGLPLRGRCQGNAARADVIERQPARLHAAGGNRGNP